MNEQKTVFGRLEQLYMDHVCLGKPADSNTAAEMVTSLMDGEVLQKDVDKYAIALGNLTDVVEEFRETMRSRLEKWANKALPERARQKFIEGELSWLWNELGEVIWKLE